MADASAQRDAPSTNVGAASTEGHRCERSHGCVEPPAQSTPSSAVSTVLMRLPSCNHSRRDGSARGRPALEPGWRQLQASGPRREPAGKRCSRSTQSGHSPGVGNPDSWPLKSHTGGPMRARARMRGSRSCVPKRLVVATSPVARRLLFLRERLAAGVAIRRCDAVEGSLLERKAGVQVSPPGWLISSPLGTRTRRPRHESRHRCCIREKRQRGPRCRLPCN